MGMGCSRAGLLALLHVACATLSPTLVPTSAPSGGLDQPLPDEQVAVPGTPEFISVLSIVAAIGFGVVVFRKVVRYVRFRRRPSVNVSLPVGVELTDAHL